MGCMCGKTEDPSALGYDVTATGGEENYLPKLEEGNSRAKSLCQGARPREGGSPQAAVECTDGSSSYGCGEADNEAPWNDEASRNRGESGTKTEMSTDEEEDEENTTRAVRLRCMVWGYEEAGARRGGASSPLPDMECVSECVSGSDAALYPSEASSDGYVVFTPKHNIVEGTVGQTVDEAHEQPPQSGQGNGSVTHRQPGPQEGQKPPRERRAAAKKRTGGKAVKRIKKGESETAKEPNRKNGPGPAPKAAPQQGSRRPSGLDPRSALLRGPPR